MITYPLKPNRISNVSLEYATQRVSFEESSYEQKVATRSTPKIVFSIEHYYLTQEDEKTLTDFFKECKGPLRQFRFYNHVDDSYYTCSFVSDALKISRRNTEFSHVSLELETC